MATPKVPNPQMREEDVDEDEDLARVSDPDDSCSSSSTGRFSPPAFLTWSRDLQFVLVDREGLELFEEFLDTEGSEGGVQFSRYVKFYFAVKGLYSCHAEASWDTCQQLIDQIYSNFIRTPKDSAPSRFYLSSMHGLREATRKDIQTRMRTGKRSVDIFDSARQETLELLQLKHASFAESKTYSDFVRKQTEAASSDEEKAPTPKLTSKALKATVLQRFAPIVPETSETGSPVNPYHTNYVPKWPAGRTAGDSGIASMEGSSGISDNKAKSSEEAEKALRKEMQLTLDRRIKEQHRVSDRESRARYRKEFARTLAAKLHSERPVEMADRLERILNGDREEDSDNILDRHLDAWDSHSPKLNRNQDYMRHSCSTDGFAANPRRRESASRNNTIRTAFSSQRELPYAPNSRPKKMVDIIFHLPGDQIPYQVKGCAPLTLAGFKALLPKKYQSQPDYRYFFTNWLEDPPCKVLCEIKEEGEVLPLWRERVIAKVEEKP